MLALLLVFTVLAAHAGGGGDGKAKAKPKAKKEQAHSAKADSHGGGHGAAAEQVVPQKPMVTILGREVVSQKDKPQIPTQTLPESLQGGDTQAAFAQRKDMQFYRHNPVQGPLEATLTVVEMTDLSCVQCMGLLAEADKQLAPFEKNIRRVSMHLPVDQFAGTNLAAFYGKLAQREDKFWEYRAALIPLKDLSGDVYFETLVNLGAEPARVRASVLSQARRIYQELDADAALAKKMGGTRPPIYLVNGVKVADTSVSRSVPITALGDLIRYEEKSASGL